MGCPFRKTAHAARYLCTVRLLVPIACAISATFNPFVRSSPYLSSPSLLDFAERSVHEIQTLMVVRIELLGVKAPSCVSPIAKAKCGAVRSILEADARTLSPQF